VFSGSGPEFTLFSHICVGAGQTGKVIQNRARFGFGLWRQKNRELHLAITRFAVVGYDKLVATV
jgi:hypothetical protein